MNGGSRDTFCTLHPLTLLRTLRKDIFVRITTAVFFVRCSQILLVTSHTTILGVYCVWRGLVEIYSCSGESHRQEDLGRE